MPVLLQERQKQNFQLLEDVPCCKERGRISTRELARSDQILKRGREILVPGPPVIY
jgi:hypothetical protein